MNILCTNKKATFKYSLTKKIEAGIVLEGWEVKSIKLGHAQISESYISINNDEAYLVNAHLKILNTTSEHKKVNSRRARKLLLSKKEIMSLSGVKQYPMSVKCGTLALHTLTSGMEGKKEEVNTEAID